MTVYIVFTGINHEGEGMVGLYSSLDEAKAFAEASLVQWIAWTAVEEWVVGTHLAQQRWVFTAKGWDS
jgi:hypothetical protein